MAGLTREQIAQREAAKAVAPATAPTDVDQAAADKAQAAVIAAAVKDAVAAANTPGPVTLPPTKTYRVAIGGVMYGLARIVEAFDGSQSIAYPVVLGERGQLIELTDREAHRLKGLNAIKGKDEPLDYEEMNDTQLDAETRRHGVTVISSGADADKPLRVDKINALRTFDQGRLITP